MKHTLTLLPLVFFLFTTGLVAQSTNVDPSAALEVESNTKGFLPPRMTTLQRNAIASPAQGLTIFNTSTNKINVYNGSQWIEAPLNPGAAKNIADIDADTKIQTEESTDEDIIRFDVGGTEVMTLSSSTLDLNAILDATELIGAWDTSGSNRLRLGDLQVLWGTTPFNSNTNQAVTFSSAFIATPIVVISGGARSGSNGYYVTGNSGSSSISTTGFTAENMISGSSNFGNWIAIGRWR